MTSDASSRAQPYFVGSKVGGFDLTADFHIAVWISARRTFCSKASVVDGRTVRSGVVVTFGILIFV